MAGLYIERDTCIEYSIVNGAVREFVLKDATLYDIDKKIEIEGWEQELVALCERMQLNVNKGRGLHAFVYMLHAKGLLPISDAKD